MGKAVAGDGKAQSGWWGDLPEVMNVEQAARYLGVSPDTLYKYLSEGRVPAFKLGNRWRLKKTTLDRWMERQSQLREARGTRRSAAAQAH